MAQKIVSFEVAKAIKEAGYPQATEYWYTKDGELCYSLSDLDEVGYISCPSYIDAWLWLWRKKEIRICLEDAKNPKEPEIDRGCYVGTNQLGGICSSQEFADPEDGIVDIIDYLVENKLIK